MGVGAKIYVLGDVVGEAHGEWCMQVVDDVVDGESERSCRPRDYGFKDDIGKSVSMTVVMLNLKSIC